MRGVASVRPYDIQDEKAVEIVNTLFDTGRSRRRANIERQPEVELFTRDELQTAARTIKNRKAAGPDGIPPEVIKEVAKTQPEWLLGVFNELLRKQTFPRSWKVARVVLILKQGKDLEQARSIPMNMSSTPKKSKTYHFNEEWERNYFFTMVNDNCCSLICLTSIAIAKNFLALRNKYQTDNPPNSKLRKRKIRDLKTQLTNQQNVFKTPMLKSQAVTTASFKVSYLLAKKCKPSSDGEFVKETLQISD
ncbi:hypothetical protein ILUMI_05883 [Ignelater luminosus]|uniref:Reverse transcriptase n=1 Tax=Ignelater luminosus TaxID=2038154 RepID=A0A8K0GFY0_IGNLU|nr:hypothetical protein ILUMI_05883 [Ignelater luminosus]